MNTETSGRSSIDEIENSIHRNKNVSNGQESSDQVSAPPPLCHLDLGVVESLPPELFSELNEVYSGKLTDFIAKRKGKCVNSIIYLMWNSLVIRFHLY